MITIGSYQLPSNIIMAPMAGCTDLPLRLIAREHGCRLSFFEMIDSHSVTRHRRKTRSLLKTIDSDNPVAVQLLGCERDRMVDSALEVLGSIRAPFLDINSACPVKKVMRKRAGAYLMHDRDNLFRIISSLVSALKVPVTVKIRTGHGNTPLADIGSFARSCQDAGASAIFIHGRTRLQGYSGAIDYGSIAAVKAAVSIPVFGSGNIFSADDARTMMSRTGCDGILVARGALGNPWIFREIESNLAGGGSLPKIRLDERKAALKRHLDYIDRYKDAGPGGKIGFMRKVAMWYIKSFPCARRVRHQITVVTSYEMMLQLIDNLHDDESAHRVPDAQYT